MKHTERRIERQLPTLPQGGDLITEGYVTYTSRIQQRFGEPGSRQHRALQQRLHACRPFIRVDR